MTRLKKWVFFCFIFYFILYFTSGATWKRKISCNKMPFSISSPDSKPREMLPCSRFPDRFHFRSKQLCLLTRWYCPWHLLQTEHWKEFWHCFHTHLFYWYFLIFLWGTSHLSLTFQNTSKRGSDSAWAGALRRRNQRQKMWFISNTAPNPALCGSWDLLPPVLIKTCCWVLPSVWWAFPTFILHSPWLRQSPSLFTTMLHLQPFIYLLGKYVKILC